MKSILTISVFIILFTSFAQKDTLGTPIKTASVEPIKSIEKDSVSKEIQAINERYESILEKDEIIDNKIAEIIKEKSKINSKLKSENKKLSVKIEATKKESNAKIDSLNSVIENYESSVVLVDSVCVRWGFLTRHLDENCKEWKLILVK